MRYSSRHMYYSQVSQRKMNSFLSLLLNTHSATLRKLGAAPRSRTVSFGFSVQRTHRLYQSGFIWRCVRDSNPWPQAWQACALTSWANTPLFGTPYRIRTGVVAVKGRCPRPLDEWSNIWQRVRDSNSCGSSRNRTSFQEGTLDQLGQLSITFGASYRTWTCNICRMKAVFYHWTNEAFIWLPKQGSNLRPTD